MKKFILLFAGTLLLASCTTEDVLTEDALALEKIEITEAPNSTSSARTAGDKVSVCHKNATDIVIGAAAVQTHIDHGDAVDMDGDGFYNKENPCSEEIDCDDTNADIYPGNGCPCVTEEEATQLALDEFNERGLEVNAIGFQETEDDYYFFNSGFPTFSGIRVYRTDVVEPCGTVVFFPGF